MRKITSEVDTVAIARKIYKALDDVVEGLTEWFAPRIPTTVLSTAIRNLDREAISILDVGCGPGVPMHLLRKQRKAFTVGIDAFLPYLKSAQARKSHDAYVLGDVRYLPFRDKSFDVVWCIEVIEHVEKEAGLNVVKAMEEIARRQVIITTPVGVYKSTGYGGNPYQEHKATWYPEELRQLGYKVHLCGLRKLGPLFEGTHGPLVRLLVRPLGKFVWAVSGILTAFIPRLAGAMVCVKTLCEIETSTANPDMSLPIHEEK